MSPPSLLRIDGQSLRSMMLFKDWWWWCDPNAWLGGLILVLFFFFFLLLLFFFSSHADNAFAYVSATKANIFSEGEVQLLPHPSCSPDLFPSNYFLFPEKATEGYPVWERERCMSSIHEGCSRHTQINLAWRMEQVVSTEAWHRAWLLK